MKVHKLPRETMYIVDADRRHNTLYHELKRNVDFDAIYFFEVSQLLELPNLSRPACIICNLSVGVAEADRLQTHLQERSVNIPLIFIGNGPEFCWTVRAMERGALTVIGYPVLVDKLLGYVQAGIRHDAQQLEFDNLYKSVQEAIEKMTPRQQTVLQYVVRGCSTKLIAMNLGVSERLIEKERSRILELFSVSSTVDVTLKLGEFKILASMKPHIGLPSSEFFRVSVQRSDCSVADRS